MNGVWVDLFHARARASGPPAQLLIDSSALKAHRSACGGREKSGHRPLARRTHAQLRHALCRLEEESGHPLDADTLRAIKLALAWLTGPGDPGGRMTSHSDPGAEQLEFGAALATFKS